MWVNAPLSRFSHRAKGYLLNDMEKHVDQKEFTLGTLSLISSPDGFLLVRLTGDWKIANRLPSTDEVKKGLTAGGRVERIGFDTSELKAWDSGLLTFLIKVNQFCSRNKIQFEAEGLPQGARRLLRLASAVPEREGARKKSKKEVFLDLIGAKAIMNSGQAREANSSMRRLRVKSLQVTTQRILLEIQACEGALSIPMTGLCLTVILKMTRRSTKLPKSNTASFMQMFPYGGSPLPASPFFQIRVNI